MILKEVHLLPDLSLANDPLYPVMLINGSRSSDKRFSGTVKLPRVPRPGMSIW